MDIRLYKKTDYEDFLVKWWKDWRWTPPPIDMLSDTGIIVSKNGVDICAGFLYYTNSKSALVEYIVSNFDYKEKDRSEAIELLINMLSEVAKDNGFKYIYTSLKSKSLIEKYQNCGFKLGDSNCQEMIKVWQH